MFRQALELAKLLWTMGQETQENKQAIKEIQGKLAEKDEQIRKLAHAVSLLTVELEHLKESERHEREKLTLRLENALLRFERRLPPPSKGEEEERDR